MYTTLLTNRQRHLTIIDTLSLFQAHAEKMYNYVWQDIIMCKEKLTEK